MAKSILQDDNKKCFLCGMNANIEALDCHHIYVSSNSKKIEQYVLKVYLHHRKCHIFGKNSVHQNADVSNQLKAHAQKVAMQFYGWDVNTFRQIFGKNYL